MGEIANLMITGKLCCECGACLDERVIDFDLGIPVICADCYRDLSKKEKVNFVGRNEQQLLSGLKQTK